MRLAGLGSGLSPSPPRSSLHGKLSQAYSQSWLAWSLEEDSIP